MTYRTLTQRARNVRLVILDVDGVLTDGSIWTGENGELVKRFSRVTASESKCCRPQASPWQFSQGA